MATMVSVRMPRELVAALNAAARARGTTRSALLRAIVEDLLDVDGVPVMREFTPAELIDDLRRRDDAELARLNALVRD